MKKTLLLLSIIAYVLFLGGCSNVDNMIPDDSIPNSSAIAPTSRVVSVDQAKAFADKAMSAIISKADTTIIKSIGTRSSASFTVSDLEPVYADNGEVVLYFVNFGDDNGYMILSADKQAGNPMLAFNAE